MTDGAAVRVLIADDSALMRRTLRRIVEEEPRLMVVDTARDGEDVVNKARHLRPDVISMDINMPKLDGISALQLVLHEGICPVVMVSSLTQESATTTFEALELGAFDFVAKPQGTVSDLGSVGCQLRMKLLAAALSPPACRRPGFRRRRGRPDALPARFDGRQPESGTDGADRMAAVALGISTGGPSTLHQVLPALRADSNAVFFLVQHMPPTFTAIFAKHLDEISSLTVLEAEPGMEVRRGHCYVARGDLQMVVHRSPTGKLVLRTPTTPVTLFRPSVNVMMESVLSIYGRRTIGVLMTGIGDDGADQMVQIRNAGGHTIAESEESAVVFGMPREAIERGGACEKLPCWEIAAAIQRRLV